MDTNVSGFLYNLALFYLPFLFALCFHEMAHGWVALKRGDNTAQLMGRLTMNPLAHMDLLGTFILPLVAIASMTAGHMIPFFGWAKPVPVNPRNLHNPKKDMFWVALAGPASNVLLGIIGSGAFVLTRYFMGGERMGTHLLNMWSSFILINLFLALFNLIPVHPLDGGKILARFIPDSWNRILESNQQIVFFIFLFLLLSGVMGPMIAGPATFTSNLMVYCAHKVLGVFLPL